MELDQLRYAVSVVDAGNFTRAAIKSGISQPSLSQQIIRLEKELGHKLFHRLGRRAVLTEAGAAFMGRARKILLDVEDATKEVRDSAAFDRTITVGAIPTLAPYILPGMIDRCRVRHPNLQINIREDFKPNLIRGVMEGELDLALLSLPIHEQMIQAEVLWQEKLVLVVSHGHPLASKKNVTAADLASETFILLGSSSSLAAQVRQFCGAHHFEPTIGARCAQVATVKALVSIDAGISILPEGTKSPADRHSIAYVVLSDAEPVRDIAVLRHMQRYQSRGSEQFLALLKEGPVRTAPENKTKPTQGSP